MDCSRTVGMGPRRRGCSDIRSFIQAESSERLHRYRERERERLHVRGEAQPLISQQHTGDIQIGNFKIQIEQLNSVNSITAK